jgi:plastocyanin
MNKFVIIGIVLVVLIAGGVAYKSTNKAGHDQTASAIAKGKIREITVTATKNRWEFVPSNIDVDEGDTVRLSFVNQDDYDHGVQIDAYGVSQRIPANSTAIIPEFVATKVGEYPFICSVSCGSGIVDGKPRGHFDQTGMLRVKARPQ